MQFTAILATLALSGAVLARGPSPQEVCISACAEGDVMCQAACVGTAHPNEDQANATIECVRNTCDQGDGSAADSAAYSVCVQNCIAQYFPTNQSAAPPSAPSVVTSQVVVSTTVAPAPTAPAGSGSSGSGGSGSSGSGSSGSSGSNGSSGSGSNGSSGSDGTTDQGNTDTGSGDGSNGASSNFKTGASFAAIAAVLVATIML